jgi:hypothetical protein
MYLTLYTSYAILLHPRYIQSEMARTGVTSGLARSQVVTSWRTFGTTPRDLTGMLTEVTGAARYGFEVGVEGSVDREIANSLLERNNAVSFLNVGEESDPTARTGWVLWKGVMGMVGDYTTADPTALVQLQAMINEDVQSLVPITADAIKDIARWLNTWVVHDLTRRDRMQQWMTKTGLFGEGAGNAADIQPTVPGRQAGYELLCSSST